MNKFSLYIITFCSVFIPLVLSGNITFFRSTQKDLNEKLSLIEDNDDSTNDIPIQESESIVIQESIGDHLQINLNDTKKDIGENRLLLKSRQTMKIYNRKMDDPDSEEVKCKGNSFVVWFDKGVVITTIDCGTYSAIYSGNKNGTPEPKYIKDKVNSVEITSEESIQINGNALSGISNDINSPTEIVVPGAGRLLEVIDPDSSVKKVYSFSIENKNFDVYLPNQSDASNRDKYSLAYEEKIFYSCKDKKLEYTLQKDGDLIVNSNVILETNPSNDESNTGNEDSSNVNSPNEDSTSSAFKITYVIPSIVALISILLY